MAPSASRHRSCPGEFIPVAERSGSIAQIDDWVLTEACREAASWPRPLRIAVNVSAAQLRRENLEAHVRQALRDSGLPGSRLELEITEGVLIEDIARAKKTMQSLKAPGSNRTGRLRHGILSHTWKLSPSTESRSTDPS
ncbi:EAL domain-containing protein (putative c-di-GMP-specific phosphodiesterase class I) [Bradyrhizobium sp. USDA 4463]